MRVSQLKSLPATTAILALLAFEASAHAAPWDKPGWQLTFQDEFEGTTVDTAQWGKRYKWGEAQVNGELQAYVDDAFQVQDGILTIVGDPRTAKYAGQSFQYASGIICSKLEQKFGYFEARLKVPAGQGMWPAFWLLGKSGSSGINEIDIHEILGHQPTVVHMGVHWGTDYATDHESDGSTWEGADFSADFHVFGLEWSADAIVWSIDGVERKRHTGEGIPQVEMYLILNLAIGGEWPGAPDSTTPFPGEYEIDYVRAYSRQADAGSAAGNADSGAEAGSGNSAGRDSGAAGGSAGRAAGGIGNSGEGGGAGAGRDSGRGGGKGGGSGVAGGSAGGNAAVGSGGRRTGGTTATGAGGSREAGGTGALGGAAELGGDQEASSTATEPGSGSQRGCGCGLVRASERPWLMALALLLLARFRRRV